MTVEIPDPGRQENLNDLRRVYHGTDKDATDYDAIPSSTVKVISSLFFDRLTGPTICPRTTVSRFCEDLDVDRLCPISRYLLDTGGNFRHVSGRRLPLVTAGPNATIEIPEINAFGQRLAALALQVFSDVVFDRLNDPRRGMTGRFKGECLFHGLIPVVSFRHLVQQRGRFLTGHE